MHSSPLTLPLPRRTTRGLLRGLLFGGTRADRAPAPDRARCHQKRAMTNIMRMMYDPSSARCKIVSYGTARVITAQPTVAPRARRRSGRTQAERSAETREKIVAGATACIAERGFGNATMFNIAHRAGVTWGAMQHHFGDKDAILDAVIDRSLREFTDLMEGLRAAEPDIERRVRGFTRRAWVAFKGPYYRVILDILLHRPEKTERIAAAFTALWTQIFGDLRLSQEQRLAAQRLTFTMLSGIATESVVVPGIEASPLHFAVLERTLTDMLRRGRRRRTASGATGDRENQGGNKNRKGARNG